jgi:hypothetical protein
MLKLHQEPKTLDEKVDALRSLVIRQSETIEEMKAAIFSMQKHPADDRTAYTVNEVAEMLGVAPYTVRGWCNAGRIKGTKRDERRGKDGVWSITAAEIHRHRNEGLLPVDKRRAG